MRKHILHILIILLCCLFYAGCALRGPDSISISVEPAKNGTITVDKDEIRFGEILEITAIPDKGYKVESFSPEGVVADPYDSTKFYYIPNSGETSKRYEPPVTSITIKGTFTNVINRTENFSVISNLKHGEISVEGDSTKKHAGDMISFSLYVEDGYNLIDDSVKICYGEKFVKYEINDDGKYIFEMPESSVFVEAEILNNLHLKADGRLFVEKGKKLTVDVRNITDFTTFDAYINTGKIDSDLLVASNIVLENSQAVVDFSNIEPGLYNFYLTNESHLTSNIIEIRVGYEGYDETWTSVYITKSYYEGSSVVLVYEPAIPRAIVNYHLAENKDDVTELLVEDVYTRIPFNYAQATEDKELVVKIYDPYLKIVSGEVTVTIPALEPEEPEDDGADSGEPADGNETPNNGEGNNNE